jgi:type IV secretory pathway protease TraF
MVALLVSMVWVRLNISPSVPYGLYRLRAVPPVLHRGDLVVLPVPASVRPWQSRWLPLLKPVAAIAGDVVCRLEQVLFVNGMFYGLIWQDAQGLPLPQFLDEETCVTITEDELFLASPVRRSLDSRYFGPVLVSALTAQAIPLWTWR